MGLRSIALIVGAVLSSAAPALDGEAALTFSSRAMQPGELVLVTIDVPSQSTPRAAVHLRAFDKEIPVTRAADRQWRALVGIDLDVKPGAYPLAVRIDGVEAVRNLVVTPKTFRTRRLTVDPDFVTPPESERVRIEEESKLLARTWRSPADRQLWTTFSAPVPQSTNSAFGTRSIFNGVPRNAHGGADFLSPAGTPVAAPSAGRVAVARNLYFSGNTVVLDHGLGLFSMLAHLSAIDVKEGDQVTARDIVGRVGATGRVTGPHLHWAVRVNDARVDPLALLAILGNP